MNDQQDQTYTTTFKSFQQIILMVSFYNLSSFYFGYTFAYFNTIPYQAIHSMFAVPFDPAIGEGLLTGCVPFGAALGGLVMEGVLNMFSRKHCFYFINGLVIISGILVLILNPYTLIVGRIIQGVCVGVFSGLVPVIVKELSPIEISGTMGGFQNAFICFGYLVGFLFSYILARFYEGAQYWIFTFSFTLITTLIQQLLFFTRFHNETPKYLLVNSRNQEAQQLISSIYLPEYQNTVYHQKLKDLQSDTELAERQVKEYPSDHWKAIFLALFLAIFQQLSGINIILLYGSELAQGFMPNYSDQFPLFINVEKLIVAILGVYLLDKFGRKQLLESGITVLILALLAFYFGLLFKNQSFAPILIILSVFIYILAFVSTFGPIMWLYFPEIIQPTKVPIAVAANWCANSIVVTCFPIIRAGCGNIDCPPVFLVLSFCMGISLLVCKIMMVETKGKTELQIREQFNN